jgi:C-methyltransferase
MTDTTQAAAISEMLTGMAWTAAVGTAVRLRLVEAMDDVANRAGVGDVAAADVAGRIGADPEAVHRLLWALSTRGLVDHVTGRRYRANAASAALRADGPGSVAEVVRAFEWSWELWPHLPDAVRTGQSVFAALHGKPLFEYLSTEAPADAEMFGRAQTRHTELMAAPVVDALDLSGVRTVADVGGGQGALLREVLDRRPHARGVLFDLPAVIAGADPAFAPGGRLADRAVTVGGDFLTAPLPSADLYLIKQVLHNWSDDDAVRILSAVASAAPPGARIAVLEPLLGQGGPFEVFHAGMDLLMLLALGGRERTEPEYAELFARSGVHLTGVRQVDGGRLAVVAGQVRGHQALPKPWEAENRNPTRSGTSALTDTRSG